MATQTIDMNNVTSVTYNNNNVTEVYLNSDKIWPLATTTKYGVRISFLNSDPETSVEYIDSAVGFNKSYMDFENDTFVWGSWQNKWPYNAIKPCLFKNGTVYKYLNPNDYSKDIDNNTVDLTGTDGDVMIEIPKIYYKLSQDTNYNYIEISDTAETGFCCLAHTYKGVEKDKIYVGAYMSQSYNDGTTTFMRSIAGIEPNSRVGLNNARTRTHNKGAGYELLYWDLMILLQCLYVIQFKNLNSQNALGLGSTQSETYNTGTLNSSGMYYGQNVTGPIKCFGIENLFGYKGQLVDGATTTDDYLYTIDSTSSNSLYGDTTTYVNRGGVRYATSQEFITAIMCTNTGGFTITNGNADTTYRNMYYCDMSRFATNKIPMWGAGNVGSTLEGMGIFRLDIYSLGAATMQSYAVSRIAYCN